MKDLLTFLLKGILGSEEFQIEESSEGERLIYKIKVEPEFMGLVIGKEGKMIRTLRNLLKVRATLEKKLVSLIVE